MLYNAYFGSNQKTQSSQKIYISKILLYLSYLIDPRG